MFALLTALHAAVAAATHEHELVRELSGEVTRALEAAPNHTVCGLQLLDLSWEALHTGPWAEVPEHWRSVYSVAAYYRAAAHTCPHRRLNTGVPGDDVRKPSGCSGVPGSGDHDGAHAVQGPTTGANE